MGSSDPTQLNSTPDHHVQDHCCPCLSCCCPGCCLCRVQAKVSQAREAWLLSRPGHPCAGEIEAAWNNCWDSADIQGCIAGIVGASDCGLCICDVLGWLGLMEC